MAGKVAALIVTAMILVCAMHMKVREALMCLHCVDYEDQGKILTLRRLGVEPTVAFTGSQGRVLVH